MARLCGAANAVLEDEDHTRCWFGCAYVDLWLEIVTEVRQTESLVGQRWYIPFTFEDEPYRWWSKLSEPTLPDVKAGQTEMTKTDYWDVGYWLELWGDQAALYRADALLGFGGNGIGWLTTTFGYEGRGVYADWGVDYAPGHKRYEDQPGILWAEAG